MKVFDCNAEIYDVIATNIATGETRVMAARKNERNAEAIVNMAVFRRGCDVEFYSAVVNPAYEGAS